MLTSQLDPAMRALMLVGFVLIVAALVWRAVSAFGARARLAKALESADPATRISAVDVATSHGIERHARVLLRVAESESDPDVLDALAEAVTRHAWEPVDNQRSTELRIWAERRRHASIPDRRPVAASPDPGSSAHRLIVTGAGGPAGINVIRALVASGHEVIALDTDPLAAGLHLATVAEPGLAADDPAFLDRLLDVANTHCADAVICTLAEEMLALAPHQDEIAAEVSIWLPSLEAIQTCLDKWRFANVLSAEGIAIPPTAERASPEVPGPWVVKPRRSRGSRGVIFVERRDDLDAALRSTEQPIVQTRLHGREFTVDALVSRDGELVGAVPRWRLETKAGISTKGRTFADEAVLEGVTSVLSAVGLEGAANVQGFVHDDAVTFIEVNPRFSGGLSLSLAAGADLVGEYVRGVLGHALRPERLAFRPETTMIRHFEEIYT